MPGAGVADGSMMRVARAQHCSGHCMCAYLQRLTGTLSIIFIEMVDGVVADDDDDDVDLVLSDAYSI